MMILIEPSGGLGIANPLNWTAEGWTALAAIAALILSQLPPIVVWFTRAKLRVEPFRRISVSHFLGHPQLSLYTQITNIGVHKVRVVAMLLKVTHEGKALELPGQGCRLVGLDNELPLTTFALAPNAEWIGLVRFFADFSLEDESTSRRLIQGLRQDIQAKQQAILVSGKPVPLVDADPESVQPLLDFYRKREHWKVGDYSLELYVQCEPKGASVTRRFRVTLFDADIRVLEDRTKNYKQGFGVYLPSQGDPEVSSSIKELT